ncbi:MAG: hypothetical protein CMF30_02670 [Kiritimatiellaceae bacterium]|nr:hypothetical protein [Kiritimatiellaceae bacterium]
MTHPLEAIVALQKKDLRLIRLLREVQDIPKRKDDIEQQVNGFKRKLEETSEQRKKIEVKINELENETSLANDRITKYKQQQMDADTNEQYRAFVKEIGTVEEEIKEFEEQEINFLEKLEDLKKSEHKYNNHLSEAQESISDELKELDERNNELNERLEQMKADRKLSAEKCDPLILKKYVRILQNKKDIAVVQVSDTNNCCGGCHMQLPPQIINDAKNINKIVNCNFCGRIVYNSG